MLKLLQVREHQLPLFVWEDSVHHKQHALIFQRILLVVSDSFPESQVVVVELLLLEDAWPRQLLLSLVRRLGGLYLAFLERRLLHSIPKGVESSVLLVAFSIPAIATRVDVELVWLWRIIHLVCMRTWRLLLIRDDHGLVQLAAVPLLSQTLELLEDPGRVHPSILRIPLRGSGAADLWLLGRLQR
mmetsp:Transcript_23067/g.22466  ORF Transcript_23067/g.22466 Transcript_23067/m.22466 type:complete len:186 (-) Transcript_23067:1094-1651(-)